PFVASRGDALGDLGASRALELLELLGQAVVRVLGEPGAIRLAAHGFTPVVLGSAQGSEQPPIRESRGTCPHAPRVRVMMIGTMPVPEHFTPRTGPPRGPDADFAYRVIVARPSAPPVRPGRSVAATSQRAVQPTISTQGEAVSAEIVGCTAHCAASPAPGSPS